MKRFLLGALILGPILTLAALFVVLGAVWLLCALVGGNVEGLYADPAALWPFAVLGFFAGGFIAQGGSE